MPCKAACAGLTLGREEISTMRTANLQLWFCAFLGAFLLTMTFGMQTTEAEVTVKLKPSGAINPSGSVLLLHVSVTCDPVGDVLEAFVTVEQEVFGEGFLNSVVCDSKKHGYLVDVRTFDGVFNPGSANASALVLICNESDNCVEGQANRTIKIKRSKKLP
jgi:hypothetical protein